MHDHLTPRPPDATIAGSATAHYGRRTRGRHNPRRLRLELTDQLELNDRQQLQPEQRDACDLAVHAHKWRAGLPRREGGQQPRRQPTV
ncbi:MAG: hypothetical protein ACLP01_14110 [Solirubrobacteraceae bacterium]